MNRTDLATALGIAGTALALTLGAMSLAPASADGEGFEDRDEAHHEREHARGGGWLPRLAIAPLDPVYREECGACHMAYPPALLPAASWDRIMSGLDDHFGDNAELDAATRERLAAYLRTSAREGDGSWAAHKLRRGLDESSAPLRISQLPRFVREHDEIPARLVRDNPQVGSFSRCEACHQDAERSVFDEDGVRIAGYGRWDD